MIGDYETLRAHWERARRDAGRVYRPEKIRRARRGEIVSALTTMHAATGDLRFGDALAAMVEHRFDRQHAGTWRIRERQEERVCIWRMHELRVRGKARSERQAAAMVAVMFCVGGLSFDAAVRKLERAYRRAKPTLEAGAFAACSQRLGRELDKRRRT